MADSGKNEIVKFDHKGKYLGQFGEEGRNKGKFSANIERGVYLRISRGNDGFIYVLDPGKNWLSAFDESGKYLKGYPIDRRTIDTPIVNSKGDIYLISSSGLRLIDCYNKKNRYIDSVLTLNDHFEFPYTKPNNLAVLRYPTDNEIIKLISGDDKLIVISNYSLKAFIIGKNNERLNTFLVADQISLLDIKERLNQIGPQSAPVIRSDKTVEKVIIKGPGMYLPFRGFIDNFNRINIVYKHSTGIRALLIFNQAGEMENKLILPKEIDGRYFCVDNNGDLYSTAMGLTAVVKYRISK